MFPRYPVSLGDDEMADAIGAYPHDGEGADELAYELRRNALRKRSDQSHFERCNYANLHLYIFDK